MSKYTKGRISAILAIRGMVPMGKLTQLTDQIMQVVEDVEQEKFNAGMERAAEMLELNYPLCARCIRKEIT